MHKQVWFIVFAVLATACSSPQSTANPVVCPALIVESALNDPANGAVNVIDTDDIVVVSGYAASSINVVASTGTVIASTTTVAIPNPLPAPNLPPRLSNVRAFRITQLAPATKYTVTPNAVGVCPASADYGSFTTQ